MYFLYRIYIYSPMRPRALVDFVVIPPGHGRSVTDFWSWDAHEAQLRCPDDVSCDIGGCSARRVHKPKFYQRTQTMVTAGILPFRENSHDRAGNRIRDLMISSQRLTIRPRGWSYIEYVRNIFVWDALGLPYIKICMWSTIGSRYHYFHNRDYFGECMV